METKGYEYETKRIDHLGIVAGICQQRKVSCGQATQAMVLNALGLSGRALDELHQSGITELFRRVASSAVDVFEEDSAS